MICMSGRYYVEKSQKKNLKQWKKKITDGVWIPDLYVITYAENSADLLDIFPYYILLQPHYKKKKMEAVGLALGQGAAVMTAEHVIMDCYRETGGFSVREWCREKEGVCFIQSESS